MLTPSRHTGRPHSDSPYLEFAKLDSTARFNLATSGVANYPLRDLPVEICDLEINGPTLYGYAPLQERLAHLCGVEPDCVVHSLGTSFANHLAMAGLFGPGDEILIEEPAYEPLVSTALLLGARLTRFERAAGQGYQIDCDEIARHMTARTRLIVLTNLHNPTSAFTSLQILEHVGRIAARHGAHVLVDEVYLETLFGRRPPSSFHLGEQFVVTGSLTKAYGLGGLRCGWILARPDLSRQLWRLNDLFGSAAVHVAERLSVIALDHLDRISRRAEELIETNRRTLRAVSGEFKHLELTIPDVGTTVFPRLALGKVEDFCRLLRDEFETSVAPGRFFEQPERFRIGLGGDPAMTREGLARLAEALKKWGA